MRGQIARVTAPVTTYFHTSSPCKGEVGWGSDGAIEVLQDRAF